MLVGRESQLGVKTGEKEILGESIQKRVSKGILVLADLKGRDKAPGEVGDAMGERMG